MTAKKQDDAPQAQQAQGECWHVAAPGNSATGMAIAAKQIINMYKHADPKPEFVCVDMCTTDATIAQMESRGLPVKKIRLIKMI